MSAVLRFGRVALADRGSRPQVGPGSILLRGFAVGGRSHAEPPMARSGENALLGVAEFASEVRQRDSGVAQISRRAFAAHLVDEGGESSAFRGERRRCRAFGCKSSCSAIRSSVTVLLGSSWRTRRARRGHGSRVG